LPAPAGLFHGRAAVKSGGAVLTGSPGAKSGVAGIEVAAESPGVRVSMWELSLSNASGPGIGAAIAGRASKGWMVPKLVWLGNGTTASIKDPGQIWRPCACTVHWLGSVAVLGRSGIAGITRTT
jgi:hypothetical protein